MTPPEIKNIPDLKSALARNPQMRAAFQQDPEAALDQFTNSPLPDNWIYRIVVLALGLTVVFIVLGIIVLMACGLVTEDKSVPTILTAIGSAAIGALSGLLAPSPKS